MTSALLKFDTSLLSVAIFTSLLLSVVYALRQVSTISAFLHGGRKRRVPPGPAGVPLLGNVFQITKDAWLTFTEWKNTYGPLIYLTVCGIRVLVINDHKTASDLPSRRANVYSGRPRWIVANELMCGGLFGVFVPFSSTWKSMRRAIHESAKPIAAEAFCSLRCLACQGNTALSAQLGEASKTTAVQFTYGSRVSVGPATQRFADFISRIIWAATPGSYLVDFLPWMKYLPNILVPWKRKAEAHYDADTAYFMDLYRDIKQSINDEEEMSCISATIAKQQEQCKLSDVEASWAASTMCVAGTDTTAASMMWLMLAICEFPEVQKRAQKELLEAVGRDRVPGFSDRPNLCYIEAIVREALRYRPMAPLGIPHVTTEDDVYNGYFIPAGTICLPNTWAMNHDTNIYGSDANEFNPDRHLDSDGNLKTFDECPEGHVTFGFGKRICVGRHVAQNAMFIQTAVLLWALTIEPLRDVDGVPQLPSLDESLFEGLLVRPLRFIIDAKPVFPEAHTILTEALDSIMSAAHRD